MARVLLSFVRIILIVVLLYYLLKLIGRWLFSGARGKSVGGRGNGHKEERYRNLTDQVIEDADYEEIEEGDEE